MWERYCRGVDAIVYVIICLLLNDSVLLSMVLTMRNLNQPRKSYTISFLSPNFKEFLYLFSETRTI